MKETLIFTFWVVSNLILSAQSISIYTPTGEPIEAVLRNESFSTELIACFDTDDDLFIRTMGLPLMRISSYSERFNCHGYAWHISRGGEKVHIFDRDELAKYFSGNNPSYSITTSITDASRAYYYARHSAYITASPDTIFMSKRSCDTSPIYLHKYCDTHVDNGWYQTPIYYYERDSDIIVLKELEFQTPSHANQIDSLQIKEFYVEIDNVKINAGFNVVIDAEDFVIHKDFECKQGATLEVF